MGDDRIAARRKLQAEAENERAKRQEAKERGLRQEKESSESQRRAARTFSYWRLTIATSFPFSFSVAWISLLVSALMSPSLAHPGTSEDWMDHWIWLAFLAAGTIALVHVLTAGAFFRAWVARLPFRVHGVVDAIGRGVFVRIAEVHLSFADTPPSAEVLRELVEGKAGGQVHRGKDSPSDLRITSPNFSLEMNNFPIARWFRKLVRMVLLDAHRAYPLQSVDLKPTQTGEFYFPSGD